MKPGDMVKSSNFIDNDISIFGFQSLQSQCFTGVVIGLSHSQPEWGRRWVILTIEGKVVEEIENKIEKIRYAPT